MDQLLLYAVQVYEILISSIWDYILTGWCRTITSIISYYWKLLKKYW